MTASRFAVDAGGSRTRALFAFGEGEPREVELPSINPSARGRAADETLDELFAWLRKSLEGNRAVGWLASAAVDPTEPSRERDRVLRAMAGGSGLSLVLSNDVLPLLWGVPALAGRGVVVVCGTGSGFLGGDGSGRMARAGGCEYLGSDEGSAFDLGMAGLRAAVRALDGRGPATLLADTLVQWSGKPVAELARALAAEPFPKARRAALAPIVCRVWRAGDSVATGIINAVLDELVLGVRAVRDRLGLPAGFAVAAHGGVLDGCPELCSVLAARLTAELGAGKVEKVPRSPQIVLGALERVLGPDGCLALPDGVRDQHAWTLEE
jgi:N-acetylglucosamine kinase-like BadF-type ATPase